jgi:hypothetical protein
LNSLNLGILNENISYKMATQTINNIANATALLAIINQATADDEIRRLCKTAAETIGLWEIIIIPDIDPEAVLSNINLDPINAAIDECNAIADASGSETVKQGCHAIKQVLNSILQKLI